MSPTCDTSIQLACDERCSLLRSRCWRKQSSSTSWKFSPLPSLWSCHSWHFCFYAIKSEEKSNVVMGRRRERDSSWLISDPSLRWISSDYLLRPPRQSCTWKYSSLSSSTVDWMRPKEYLPLTSRLFLFLCQYHDELLSICRLNCSGLSSSKTFTSIDTIWLIDDSPSYEIIV